MCIRKMQILCCFYITDLSICKFWYLQEFGPNPACILRDGYTYQKEFPLIRTQFRKANYVYQYLVHIRKINLILHFAQKASSEMHDHL